MSQQLNKPLRIFVDLEPLSPGGENGGIKPSLREMYLWLGAQTEQPFEFVYLCRSETANEVRREWMRPNDKLVLANESSPDIASQEGCQIIHCGFGTTKWICPGVPAVLIISDLLHRDYPESLSPEAIASREERFLAAVAQADLFQVVSDYTGSRLTCHYGVSPERILRTYHPIHDRLARSESPAPSPAYFFYPANAWPHKNHNTLLVAYAHYLHELGRESAWKLILTGHDDEAMLRLQSLADSLVISDQVEFRGYVDESTLAQLWSQAAALIFPSLHEGFGNPLVEAMYYGTPILAANATAIPEVCADAALLVDGRAPLALAQGMKQITSDATLRHALTERGKVRAAQLKASAEFGKLIPLFQKLVSTPLRPKPSQGYYHSDKLTGPNAFFSLPAASNNPCTLRYEIQPLGLSRTVEVYANGKLLTTLSVAANIPSLGEISLPSASHTIRLHTINASRVSEADTRILGVRLTKLEIQNADTHNIDLLNPLSAAVS